MKLRHPVSPAYPVRRLIEDMAAGPLAVAVRRTERLVHYWADPDSDLKPTLVEATVLDAAWLAAGRGSAPEEAPIAGWYVAELHRLTSTVGRAQSPLAHLAAVMREVGDVARQIEMAEADGNLTANERARICAEAREALDRLAALIRDLAPAGPSR